MDADVHKKAMDTPRYRRMMDKVDPRTFAARARGVDNYGRNRNDDKKTMKKAAIDAFNEKHGIYNASSFGGNSNGPVEDEYLEMYNSSDSDSGYGINTFNRRVDMMGIPRSNHQGIKLGRNKGEDSILHRTKGSYESPYNEYSDNRIDAYNPKFTKAIQIGRQMARGSGFYNPTSGWHGESFENDQFYKN